ncbi:MAG TPA: hypothetical protein ENN34_08395 [Deltaproteobacteria bacterium]|nr:hypothetical protein [Deltaproteobacteria bacterium]
MNRFRYRTRLFSMVRQNRIPLVEYQAIIRHREHSKRIFTTIYTCEFVGFLNQHERRVGCLLHPMGNDGKDLRDVSFYGRALCEGHFCPSYEKLETNEAEAVLATVDDWYLYGVVITDIDFVKTFFKIVQNRLGERVRSDVLRQSARSMQALHRFFATKREWPFRDSSRPRFGKYYFLGEEYAVDRIDYTALGSDPSRFDGIFLGLSSLFHSRNDLVKAEAYLNSIVEEFCDGYNSLDRSNH